MKSTIALMILTPLLAAAQQLQIEPAPKMSALQASTNLNQEVCLTSQVAQVSIRDKLVYLNLEEPFPKTPLACVIFAKNTNQFVLQSLPGKRVEITGRVTEFKGKPQIILTSSNQLKVLEAMK